MRSEPQSRQRVMQVSIPSGSRMRVGKPGNELSVGILLLFGKGNRDAHAAAGFDTLDEAVYLDRAIELQTCREASTDPERVDRFDKHAIGTDIPSAGAEHR